MSYAAKTGMYSVFDNSNTFCVNNNSKKSNFSAINNINILILLSIILNILL